MAKATPSAEGKAAAEQLEAYRTELAALHPADDFRVIGAKAYGWRYQHALLLPWTPAQLLALAHEELAKVDAELAELKPKLAKPAAPTERQIALAKALTRESLLGLYDTIERANREATVAAGFVTIPPAVGPMVSRETPDALVPLTGDGGSMNPPPTYVASNVGYWNVEHFHAEWPLEARLEKITQAEGFLGNGLGPYSAHEGYPGHHLQLAIARLHPDPIRSILPDSVQNEGWGLYAEEALWQHGGFGPSPEARSAMLRSYRYRIARVVYDVNIETGAWDLQKGADFKDRAEPGKGEVDEDVLRAIQWPAQLIGYFAGKMQLRALREASQKKLGARYDERAFHDAFLAEGSIPIALIRAKMLGEPIPAR